MVTAPRRRIVVIDLLRTLSIVAVLAVHIGAAGVVVGSDAGTGVFHRFARNGSHGVTVFFVVSGFVITETILRWAPDPRHMSLRWFYAKRVGRLVPLAVVVLPLGAVVAVVAGESPAQAFVLRDPSALFDGWFVASFPALSFNWLRIAHEPQSYGFGLHWDVYWSLAIEEQFYLFFPLLLRWLGIGRRLVVALLGFVALGLAWRYAVATLYPDSVLWPLTSSPAAFDQLAIGVLACLASRAIGARRAPWAAPAVIVGLALASWTWAATDLAGPAAHRVWPQTAIAVGVAAVIVGGCRLRFLDRVPMALTAPGQLSYGMYLLHGLVLFATWGVVRGSGPWPALAFYVLAVVAVAWPVFRFFEQPANWWVRTRLGGSARREPAPQPRPDLGATPSHAVDQQV